MGLKEDIHDEPPPTASALSYSGIDTVVITRMRVSKDMLLNGTTLFHCKKVDRDGNTSNREETYKTHKNGVVVERVVKRVGDKVHPGDILLFYEPCSHSTVFKEICCDCGLDLSKLDRTSQKKIAEDTSVSMVHSIPELRITKQLAEDYGKSDMEDLLQRRKLVLLVDLDQTIIHSTNQNVPADRPDIFHYKLYGEKSPWYHTKFRPYMKEFLQEISKYYQLDVCTFGARRYAHQICKLIDPHSKYFPSDRILSRDEFFDPRSKTGNMKSLFPCGDSMVCIIDDRMDVWNYAKNVIHVKPYLCFKTDDINAPEKLSKSFDAAFAKEEKETEKKDDEKEKKDDKEIEEEIEETKEKYVNVEKKPEDYLLEDNDDYLIQLEVMLKRVHSEFFKAYDEKKKYASEGEEIRLPDLKEIIPMIRRQTLEGVKICFSGVIAMNHIPEHNRYYRLAVSMGAKITSDILTENGPMKTTHLVCAKWGSSKMKKASECGDVKIVTPYWLLACAERWQKLDEAEFEVTKETNLNMIDLDDPRKVFFPYYEPTGRPRYELQPQAGPSRFDEEDLKLLDEMNSSSKFDLLVSDDIKAKMLEEVMEDLSDEDDDDEEDEEDDDDEGDVDDIEKDYDEKEENDGERKNESKSEKKDKTNNELNKKSNKKIKELEDIVLNEDNDEDSNLDSQTEPNIFQNEDDSENEPMYGTDGEQPLGWKAGKKRSRNDDDYMDDDDDDDDDDRDDNDDDEDDDEKNDYNAIDDEEDDWDAIDDENY